MNRRASTLLAAWSAAAGLCGCRPGPVRPPEPSAASPAPAPASGDPATASPVPTPAPPASAAAKPSPPTAAEPPASVVWSARDVPPLQPADRESFWGSPEDAPPEVRGGIVKELENVHYTIGNEWALYAFYEDVKDLGGGYVGVGPDQAYLFIGWQRPHLAWLVDYDTAVLRTHDMYRALFFAAQTPKEFLAYFEPEALTDACAAIDALYDGRQARGLKGLLRRQRRYFRYRLQTLRKRLRGVDVPTYLTDQETFDYVKAMLRTDRVRPLLVNLNERAGIGGINEVAQGLRTPIRVVYVSNAEEYWKAYKPEYVDNMTELHTDARSLLLRTRLTWKTNHDYMYIVQTMDNYRVWLHHPSIVRVRDILSGRPFSKSDVVNYWRVEHLPGESPRWIQGRSY